MNITSNDIDWKNILIKKYQSYGLDELDTMVLFVSDAVLNIQPDVLLTCDILSPYMKANKDDIDQSLSKLMAKKYLTILQKGSSFSSSLADFKEQLFKDEIKDLVLKGGLKEDKEAISDNLYAYIESINGPLSPIEKDRIASWIKDGASEDVIREACKKAVTKNGHVSFNTAETYILQSQRSQSRKTIGISTVNEKDKKMAALEKLIDTTSW